MMTKITTDTLSEANDISDAILEAHKHWWLSQGGDVVNGEIVPKNQATGLLDYSAQRTLAWQSPVQNGDKYEVYSSSERPYGTLKALAAAKGIKFGTAVNRWHLANVPQYRDLIAEQCGIIVAENSMKWVRVEENYNQYTFEDADNAMEFAEANDLDVRFHAMLFQDKYPAWVDPQSATEAMNLLDRYVQDVLVRWKGKMTSWDIINEPFMSLDGTPYYETVWTQQIGASWIKDTLELVDSYNLGGKLVLNENGFKNSDGISVQKRNALLSLVENLVADGVPIHAVGIQSHLKANKELAPKADWQQFITDLSATGVEVYITELDIDDREISGTNAERAQAAADYIQEYVENTLEVITPQEFLTWGIYDNASLNNDGNPNGGNPLGHPTLYDGDFNKNPLWATLEKIFLQL